MLLFYVALFCTVLTAMLTMWMLCENNFIWLIFWLACLWLASIWTISIHYNLVFKLHHNNSCQEVMEN